MRLFAKSIAALFLFAFFSVPVEASPYKGDFPWRDWSDEVFAQAKRENKFVILSLQSWWCPWCYTMNVETFDNPEVRKVIAANFIPVRVDQDSRPEISQRYERWGWPATVIFAPDGTEIVKLRGFYSPQFFIPILNETVKDPSPVDYGKFGGEERPLLRLAKLADQDRADIVAFMEKAYDEVNGGWGRSKLVDGPTYIYALEKAKMGDAVMMARARRAVDQLIKLVEPKIGAVAQVSLKSDWSKPSREYPMFAQEGALKAFSLAYALWGDKAHLAAAAKVVGFLNRVMIDHKGGGFYTSYGLERGNPGVDRRQYARENGLAIQGLLAYYDVAGDAKALGMARRSAEWALANRALPGGGFRHAEKDQGGPYLVDTLAMGQAFLALYRSTGERHWLARAKDAGDFIAKNFIDSGTGGFVASASPDGMTLIKPIKQKDDNVAAVRFFNLLAAYSGNEGYRSIAEGGMGYLASPAILEAFGFLPDVLQAEYELTSEPVHVTVIGSKKDPKAAALYHAALRYPAAHKRAEWWDRSEGPLYNADVNYPEYPQAAAFACTSRFCSLPITAAKDLPEALDRLQRDIP